MYFNFLYLFIISLAVLNAIFKKLADLLGDYDNGIIAYISNAL